MARDRARHPDRNLPGGPESQGREHFWQTCTPAEKDALRELARRFGCTWSHVDWQGVVIDYTNPPQPYMCYWQHEVTDAVG